MSDKPPSVRRLVGISEYLRPKLPGAQGLLEAIGKQNVGKLTLEARSRLEAMLAVDDLIGTVMGALQDKECSITPLSFSPRTTATSSASIASTPRCLLMKSRSKCPSIFGSLHLFALKWLQPVSPPTRWPQHRYRSNHCPPRPRYSRSRNGWPLARLLSSRQGRTDPVAHAFLVENWFRPAEPVQSFFGVRTAANDAVPSQLYVDWYGKSGSPAKSSTISRRIPINCRAFIRTRLTLTHEPSCKSYISALKDCVGPSCREADSKAWSVTVTGGGAADPSGMPILLTRFLLHPPAMATRPRLRVWCHWMRFGIARTN